MQQHQNSLSNALKEENQFMMNSRKLDLLRSHIGCLIRFLRRKVDIKKETAIALRTIDYARNREYNISDLLKYELTNLSIFPDWEGHIFEESTKK